MHPFIAEQLVADRHAQLLAEADHSRLVRAAAADRPLAAQAAVWPRWRFRLGVGTLALVAGLLSFASTPAESRPHSSPSQLGSDHVTLVGLRPDAAEPVSYAPGASRTWPPGRAIIGVKVLSGRLTVYGAEGERRVYVAGEGYAAGWAAYRTVNETDAPVETLVTNHVRA